MREVVNWTPEMIHELIILYKQYPELWNIHSEDYRNRKKRAAAVTNICNNLKVTSEQFSKKIHNLRNQFNAENKRLIKREEESGNGELSSRWEYFNSLKFLESIIATKPGYANNIKRETEYTIICDTHSTEIEHDDNQDRILAKGVRIEVERIDDATIIEECHNEDETKNRLEGGQSRVIYRANTPEPSPAKRPRRQDEPFSDGNQTLNEKDDYDLFGSFIASEMRNLSSAASRRKMKMKILQVIVEIGLEDNEIASQFEVI